MGDRNAVTAGARIVVRRYSRDTAVVDARLCSEGQMLSSGEPVFVRKREDGTDAYIEPGDAAVIAPFVRLIHEAIGRLPDVVREMQLIYAFALYEGAKTDLLTALLKAWPELVRLDRTITYREAAQIASVAELRDVVIARETQWYTDGACADQFSRLEERLRIAPDESNGELREGMVALHALRNVLVHNSGIVDARYASAMGDAALPIGLRVDVSKDVIDDAMKRLRDYVVWLALAISQRYGTGATIKALWEEDTTEEGV